MGLIRDGKLTGVELVRREDEERWQPLYETAVFRREVPSDGDPRSAAGWRLLRALGGHFSAFFIVSAVMLSTQGHLPFWLGIWAAVLLMQALGRAAGGLALFSHRTAVGAGTPAAPPPLPAARRRTGRRSRPGPRRRRPPRRPRACVRCWSSAAARSPRG